MPLYDLNIGYPCDHRFRQFVNLVATLSPTEWSVQLLVTLPDIGENFILYKNEVKLEGVSFVRSLSPKAVTLTDLTVPAVYPQDDWELEFNVVPELCPKCKALSPFGT